VGTNPPAASASGRFFFVRRTGRSPAGPYRFYALEKFDDSLLVVGHMWSLV